MLAACSDKSLRVIDLNKQQEVQSIPKVHSYKVSKVLQVTGANLEDDLYSLDSSSSYNLFLTGALSDGVKLWDLRQVTSDRDSNCVQRFDWPGSDGGRLAPGFDLSPCLKYLAVAAEDGFCYIFDTRKPGAAYLTKLSR